MSVFFRQSSIADKPVTVPKSEYDALTGEVRDLRATVSALLGVDVAVPSETGGQTDGCFDREGKADAAISGD